MSLVSIQHIQTSFSRASESYEDAAQHQKNSAEKLVNIYCESQTKQKAKPQKNKKPKIIVDLGSGTGFVRNFCASKKLAECIISTDISFSMLEQQNDQPYKLCLDNHKLAFKENSVPLMFSSYAFQWSNDINVLLASVFYVLQPGGFIYFSVPGEGTFEELNEAWLQVDQAVHVHKLASREDWRQAIDVSGFMLKHESSEHDLLRFQTQKQCLTHIKAIGAHNLDEGRSKGLLGKQRYKHFSTSFKRSSRYREGYSLSYQSYYFALQKPYTKTQYKN